MIDLLKVVYWEYFPIFKMNYVGFRTDGQGQRVEINAAAMQWKATGMATNSLSYCII